MTGMIGLVTAVLNHRWQKDERTQERIYRLDDAQAELRRNAYTRFLVATDVLADFILTQPVRELDEADPLTDLANRLRVMRASGKEEFDEFNASYLQVKFVCGDHVDGALTAFYDWFIERFASALRKSDIMKSQALDGLEEVRLPLIETMKAEQRIDLGIGSQSTIRR